MPRRTKIAIDKTYTELIEEQQAKRGAPDASQKAVELARRRRMDAMAHEFINMGGVELLFHIIGVSGALGPVATDLAASTESSSVAPLMGNGVGIFGGIFSNITQPNGAPAATPAAAPAPAPTATGPTAAQHEPHMDTGWLRSPESARYALGVLGVLSYSLVAVSAILNSKVSLIAPTRPIPPPSPAPPPPSPGVPLTPLIEPPSSPDPHAMPVTAVTSTGVPWLRSGKGAAIVFLLAAAASHVSTVVLSALEVLCQFLTPSASPSPTQQSLDAAIRKQARMIVRSNSGLRVLLALLRCVQPVTSADEIRAKACHALLGLVEDAHVKQILDRLHVSTILAELARDPVHPSGAHFHEQFRSSAVQLMAKYVVTLLVE